jgi:hypothetical protein
MIVTARLNTTIVKAGEEVEVRATKRIKALVAAGVLIDVTPKKKPKEEVVEPSDDG